MSESATNQRLCFEIYKYIAYGQVSRIQAKSLPVNPVKETCVSVLVFTLLIVFSFPRLSSCFFQGQPYQWILETAQREGAGVDGGLQALFNAPVLSPKASPPEPREYKSISKMRLERVSRYS